MSSARSPSSGRSHLHLFDQGRVRVGERRGFQIRESYHNECPFAKFDARHNFDHHCRAEFRPQSRNTEHEDGLR